MFLKNLPITTPNIPPNRKMSMAPPTSLILASGDRLFAIDVLRAILREYNIVPDTPTMSASRGPILPIRVANTTSIHMATLKDPFIEYDGSIITFSPLNPYTNTLFQNVETRGYNCIHIHVISNENPNAFHDVCLI
mgnify:CR=1 FL=1